ncbi:hypothetical protein CCY99_01615 [Helicobacter sp. 16-1353]|uniref:hypothetical protein n=1 Tax=Helicobacter sp. 16-1353 TaxID=2004996 RepID=UPI000DCBD3C6|nr:hypothetical protein [Helicobacter sp. 16-1353]RAX54870.1 hypothetical protein CCY99_01615 [Helicobacter sp. 16-1353]
MKILLCFCLIICHLFGAWVMFSDGEDTYIYNNTNGDIYIRYRKNGKNYEDVFVKMPSGVIPKNLDSNINKKEFNGYNYENNSNPSNDDLLNKLQDIQNSTLNKVLE